MVRVMFLVMADIPADMTIPQVKHRWTGAGGAKLDAGAEHVLDLVAGLAERCASVVAAQARSLHYVLRRLSPRLDSYVRRGAAPDCRREQWEVRSDRFRRPFAAQCL